MFHIYNILLLLSAAAYTYAAVAFYPEEPKPAEFANKEGCYLSSLNRVLPYDEPYFPRDNKTCVKYTCNRAINLTQLATCGAMAIAYPGCPIVEDLTKDYPECCPMNYICV